MAWFEDKLAGRPIPPLVLVVGLGDGQLLDLLDKRAPATRVLALEPRRAVADRLRTRPQWKRWTDANRLQYLVGPDYAGADEASRTLPVSADGHLTLIDPALERQIDEPFVNAVRVLKQIVFGAQANAEARRRFAPRYLANTLANLPAILGGRDVTALAHAFRGVPAVVAGAGPSLDRNIEELKPLRDRALIIASDTALRPMLNAGLAPQFVVGVDPGEINSRHFRWLPERPQTWLVGEPSLDPVAAEPFGSRAFWFRVARHQPWPWYEELGIDVGQLEVWGSVLTAAFQFAVFAGCDPIVFAGADLSFTDGRPYARGTTFEIDWAKAVGQGTALPDQWRARIAAAPDHIETADLRGVTTSTTRTLLSFRDWLVARAARSGRRVINASGAGMLFGDSVEQASLGEVLRKPAAMAAIDTIGRAAPRTGGDLVRVLRTVRESVTATARSGWGATWTEFCGGSMEAAPVARAIDAALNTIEAGPNPAAATDGFHPKAGIVGLPEREAVLRAALAGSAIPEWTRGPALTGLLGEDAVEGYAGAAWLLHEALGLTGTPWQPGTRLVGDDVRERWGAALLNDRTDWSDAWRAALWDYHDALAIAAAAPAPCPPALAAATLESSLQRLASDIDAAPRACATADLKIIHPPDDDGVHGYNLLPTSTGWVAAEHRLGPRDLSEAPHGEIAELAALGLLLWAPTKADAIARLDQYLRHVVWLVLVQEWATVTRCPLPSPDIFRTLLRRAAGVRA